MQKVRKPLEVDLQTSKPQRGESIYKCVAPLGLYFHLHSYQGSRPWLLTAAAMRLKHRRIMGHRFQFDDLALTRRELLHRCGMGLGALALGDLIVGAQK